MHLFDSKVDFHNGDGFDPLVIQRSQEIPQDFLDKLKAEREASKSTRAGEFHKAASIPVAVHEKWLREGYDLYKEPIRNTLLKLQTEGLDAFVTTNKAL